MASEELTKYVATLRCVINTGSEVDAMLAADRLQAACMELLDEEDEDAVYLTQVTSISTDLEPTETLGLSRVAATRSTTYLPTETLLVLTRARNALIRTRIKQCYVEAQALDQIIHALSRRYIPDIDPQYDYGRFMEVAEEILTHGKDPL